MRNPHQFWTNARNWPSPILGYVFIAEAMQAIGRARFPRSWTGEEPWASMPLLLPRQQHLASAVDVYRAHSLLGRSPAVSPFVIPPGSPPMYGALDEASWREAGLKGAEESLRAAKAAGRWWDVKEITTRLFRVGGLKLFLRPHHGGKLEGPQDDSLWNTEEVQTDLRFGVGLIDFRHQFTQIEVEPTTDPNDPRCGQQDFRYMYVDKKSLDFSLDAVTRVTPPSIWIRDEEPAIGIDSVSLADSPPELAPTQVDPRISEMERLSTEEPNRKKKRGRPEGSTNWDTTRFIAEYTRRLVESGEPSKQKMHGWTSKEEAASSVLDVFYSGLDESVDPPSISTAKLWAERALAAWKDAGSFRSSEESVKSDTER